jgi:hypothetical protein
VLANAVITITTGLRAVRAHLAQQVEAAAARHLEVGDHEVEVVVLELRARGREVADR